MDLRLVALEVEVEEEEDLVVVVADHSRAMGLQEDDSDCCCPFPAMEAIEDIAIDCEWMSFFSGGGLEPTFFGTVPLKISLSKVFPIFLLCSCGLARPSCPFTPLVSISLGAQ